jgi:phage shock protein A
MAVQRAEDKTAELQARAGAVDELLASGALEDVTGTSKDDITLELERLASTSDVELELAKMKAQIGAGPAAAAALEGGAVPAAAAPSAPAAIEPAAAEVVPPTAEAAPAAPAAEPVKPEGGQS